MVIKLAEVLDTPVHDLLKEINDANTISQREWYDVIIIGAGSGTANDNTLLYGVKVKFYNMEVEVNEQLMSRHEGLYIIGDGSGITHSLSHVSASSVHVARDIANK